LCILVVVWLFGGHYPEATCAANDFDQAQGRVFEALRRIIECSPALRTEAKIVADKITFPAIGATITAIPSDYAGAAGGNPTISCFDELWAYTSERSRRLWDELIPPPTRKIACRLTCTYAGYEGESALLEELHKRGLASEGRSRPAALKGKRDALTAELAETDPKLGDQLVDILTPIKAVDEKIARLGGAGGAGIAKELRLPGSGGSREWPPPRPFDPAWFTPFRSIAATRSTGEKSKKKPPPAVATCGL
jgi:hypothetical protein